MLQPRYFEGARARAQEYGYKLEPFYIDDYPSAKAASRVLHARGIRGIVVSPIANPDSTRAMNLEWDKFTAVCCGIGRIRPPLHTVSKDVFGTTRLVWEIATAAGYKRIGAALNRHNPVAEDDWLRIGASEASIRLMGLEESANIPFLTSEVGDDEALMRWYKRYKPELIIGFNHSTGEALERNGVRIPEEVEFVSLIAVPGLKWSGLNHSYEHIAQRSVDVLHDEIRNNRWGLPSLPNIILVDAEWNPGTTFRRSDLAEEFVSRHLRSSARTVEENGGSRIAQLIGVVGKDPSETPS